MAQSKEFVDASHALNDLSHALALLESENASLRGAADGLCNENARLRELVARMAEALGIDCEWADPNCCKSPCRLEFGCWPEDMAIRCPAWAAMRDLGVGVNHD